ncbi:MAG: hypothetical protein ABIG29_03035 [Candidatus Nealsonbacteria bacterium]
MVIQKEERVECDSCGSKNVEFQGKMEDEQFGFDTEGGGVGRTYLGTEVKKDYLCRNCGRKFRVVEIKKD